MNNASPNRDVAQDVYFQIMHALHGLTVRAAIAALEEAYCSVCEQSGQARISENAEFESDMLKLEFYARFAERFGTPSKLADECLNRPSAPR